MLAAVPDLDEGVEEARAVLASGGSRGGSSRARSDASSAVNASRSLASTRRNRNRDVETSGIAMGQR
ncbi:hypothetical protein GCM10009533_39730 [Saccharopolyspora spinosporotrichia]|uniref:Uncharacterized protein n=1 Tax=Saccharopolyspora erythraea TaxID=1836 RepID=A0ABN1D7J3_SACER|nr:hypothetical protein N599_25900 [Saccharopolyspora erythraea D]